ncbi:MAG: type IV pilus assembly protein PilM, partial [bacterium]|nr:type IV pilus assembly protein PilM [bacterium]
MELKTEEDNYFGLDLGNSGIRVVQLKKSGDKPALATYGDVETPFALLTSDSPVDQDKLAEIIKKLVNDANISTKNVVAGLKAANVFSSVINMPKLSSQELAHAIRFQADKYIPMALDQAKLDYFVIGQSPTKEEEMEVLLVATPTNMATKYLNICQKAGLELMALDINAIAQARSLVPGDISAVIVDFGSLATDITVVASQIPRLIRSVNVGAKSFKRVVRQNLGLDEDQASQFIQKFGLLQT